MNHKIGFKIVLFLLFFSKSIFSQCGDYVRIEGKKFKCGGSDFFPLSVNYCMDICSGTNTYVTNPCTFPENYPTRHSHNFTSGTFTNVGSAASGYSVMLKDFQDIRALGFNTVKVLGAGGYREPGFKSLSLGTPTSSSLSYTNANYDNMLLDFAANIIQAAKVAGLKVILYVEGSRDNPDQTAYLAYLASLATKFKYEPTLMAIDFSNEPDTHEGAYLNKTNACTLTASWHNAVKNNSQILTTLNLTSSFTSIFSLDPNVLNVDFISFQTYTAFEPPGDYPASDISNVIGRIKSELLWRTKNLSLPWIIGETSASAAASQTAYPISHALDPSPMACTYSLQTIYLEETLKACRDYGGAGYNWWSYMDSYPGGNWGYLGIVECNDGTSTVVAKPAAAVIYTFNPTPTVTPFPSTTVPSQYYDAWSLNTNFKLSGQVTDGTSGIKDAIVRMYGFTPSCTGTPCDLGATRTNSVGNFTVYANNYFASTSSITTMITLSVSAVDCSEKDNDYWSVSGGTANITYTTPIVLTKIARPSASVVAYSSQTVSAVSIFTTATASMTFSNYVINSGTFNAKAAERIDFYSGFSVAAGTDFKASISPYYHDCSALVTGTTAFRSAGADPGTNVITDIKPEISLSDSYLYPNPGQGLYNIKMTESNYYTIEVYNMYGSLVKIVSFDGTESAIDITDASPGLYLFKALCKKKIVNTWKVIKQ